MWESSGWITGSSLMFTRTLYSSNHSTEIDPYGWFQWYCRFYLGRRCRFSIVYYCCVSCFDKLVNRSDDDRQISRGLGVIGPTGRWRRNLINKCIASEKKPEDSVNDFKISPKVRQLLQVVKCVFDP